MSQAHKLIIPPYGEHHELCSLEENFHGVLIGVVYKKKVCDHMSVWEMPSSGVLLFAALKPWGLSNEEERPAAFPKSLGL